MKKSKVLFWSLRIIPTIIMLQTLNFKFLGADESVYIFSTIGIEPWGRYLSGSVELVASILLLSRWNLFGALLGAGTMTGAIFFHLTKLGIVVQDDGGLLFILAMVTFLCCVALIFLNKDELKRYLSLLKK